MISLTMVIVGYSQTSTKTNSSVSNINSHNIHVHANANTGQHHDSHHHGSHGHSAKTKQYKVSFNSGTVEINGIGELEILSTDGTEVIIESDIENHDKDHRSVGLKSLNSAGIDDNTGMGISAIKNDNGSTLELTQIGNECNCHGVKVYVPKAVKVSVNHKSIHGEYIKINDISNEIIISTLYQDVDLINITGPMSVKTVYGSVEADFNTVSQKGSITINAVYGLVDVSLPSDSKANLELSASYGEILSDMNVEVEKNGDLRSLSTTKVKGTLNGGGVLVKIKSSYENVYLRSK